MKITAPEPLLTIADVADLLQFSTKSIWRWIKTGDLAASKLGGQWRVHPRDLELFRRERLLR